VAWVRVGSKPASRCCDVLLTTLILLAYLDQTLTHGSIVLIEWSVSAIA
jgi:hypothetical protein